MFSSHTQESSKSPLSDKKTTLLQRNRSTETRTNPKRSKVPGSLGGKMRSNDPDVIWTRNLLIWSQTRYHCATESQGIPDFWSFKPPQSRPSRSLLRLKPFAFPVNFWSNRKRPRIGRRTWLCELPGLPAHPSPGGEAAAKPQGWPVRGWGECGTGFPPLKTVKRGEQNRKSAGTAGRWLWNLTKN